MSNLGIFLICLTVIIIMICLYLMKFGCKHKWIKVQEINVWGDSIKYPEYKKYVCQCNKCGKIKVYKT